MPRDGLQKFLTRWVSPGKLNIRDVRTIAVERCFINLVRKDAALWASIESEDPQQVERAFNHCHPSEWLEQARKPILLVRRVPSGKESLVAEPKNWRAILSQLDWVFVNGLPGRSHRARRRELLALKVEIWSSTICRSEWQAQIYMNV